MEIYSDEKELSNKNVFSCLMNTVNEGAEVTLIFSLTLQRSMQFKCCQTSEDLTTKHRHNHQLDANELQHSCVYTEVLKQ